jgi:antitoxin (DNA-binding transcriptional repressor) of toxin-antitoxin stability system
VRLGLRDANQKFARVIRAVRSGQDVVLTDRGEPLAVIRRIAVDDAEARLAALVEEGLVAPAANPKPMPAPRWRPEALSGGTLADTVRRDRDETA